MLARCLLGRARVPKCGVCISEDDAHTRKQHIYPSPQNRRIISIQPASFPTLAPSPHKEGPAMFNHLKPKDVFFGLSLFATLALSLFITNSAHAQVVGATLSGTVADASGAVMPQAHISIKNIATGVVRSVTTDSAGFYTAPNLLPGNYQITISARGFRTQVRTGITLTVGAQQVLNITMQIGQVTQTVQVSGAAPTVQLGSSSISAVVNATTVRQLPLNGRSWTDLAKLQPGVDAIQTQPSFATGADRGNRGFGAQLTISGQRPVQNNYRLDGVSLNDYSNGAPGSVLGGNLGVDAIQEFSVLTSNYSAEYGKTSGGVVNAITKSGTNQFHGDAYEFVRNASFDAANFFDNFSNSPKPSFRRNQFGASAGGPIQKDKTFVFGDYEGVRQAKGFSTITTTLSPAARAGNLCTNPAGSGSPPTCSPSTVAVNPSAAKYFTFFPLPNGPIQGNGDTGIFSFTSNQVISENYWTARVDHTFSSKDSMFGTYMYDVPPYNQPDGLNNVLVNSETDRQFVVLEETHIFSPTLVNSVRAGYNRDGVADDIGVSAINPAAADTSLAAIPGQHAAQVNMPGLTHFTGGVLGNAYYHYYWNSFQGYDDAFYTRGTHSIKFGVAVERMQNNVLAAKDPSGAFNFPSIASFLTNQPSRFEAGLSSTLTPRGFRQTLFGTYVQDDWRFRPNLTLNLGLRYEMITMPSEVQGKLVNLSTIYAATPLTGSTFIHNPTLRNFEPRVGFAWDPSHNGKTAVRGGFGIFDALPLPVEFTLMETQQVPFFSNPTINSLPAGSFFNGVALTAGGTGGASYFPIDAKRNYVMQYNLNIQRQITPSLTAMIGYIGSRGVHDGFRSDDINMVVPVRSSAGYLFPSPAGTGTVFNPNFGIMHGQIWAGDSSFNSLEAGVTKNMSHGVQLQGSFTWGKSIDQGSASAAGDQFANSLSSLPFYDLHSIQSVSDFNVGRTLVINAIWDIPTPSSWTGVPKFVLGGWELGGIFTASDGTPFTATWRPDGDPQGLNSCAPWDFPIRLTGPG